MENKVSESNYEIFLSYRRSDGLLVTKLIEKYLIELGYPRPFFDLDVLKYGDQFSPTIGKAIENCKDFILIITPDTFKRVNNMDSYVINEIEWALEHQVHIVPMLLSGASFPKDNQIPERIRKLSQLHAAPLEFRLDMGEDLILDSLGKQFSTALYTKKNGFRKVAPEITGEPVGHNIIQAQNLEKFDLERLDRLCGLIAMSGKDGGYTVLDVGCGNGSCGRSRFASDKYAKVIGIDVDANRIEQAKQETERLKKDGSADGCDYDKFVYYTLDIDLTDRSELTEQLEKIMLEQDIRDGFDIAFVANVLHLLKHPKRALARIHNVLRTGGYIYARCPDDRMKMADGDNGRLAQIISDTQALGIRADRMAGGKQYRWLENAHFRKVEIEAIFRSTDGMTESQRIALFKESFAWRKNIADEICRSSCPVATRRICDSLLKSINELDEVFTSTYDFWYCEVDVVAIATKL